MKSETNLKRRNFLLAAALGGAGALAAVVTEGRLTPQTASPPPASMGYRVTEHVRRYYRSARI